MDSIYFVSGPLNNIWMKSNINRYIDQYEMLLFQNNYKWFAIIFFHKHLVRLTFIVAEIYWYRKRIHFCFSPFIVESTSTRHVFTYFWHNKDKLYGEEQNLRYCNTTVANFVYNLSQFSLHFICFTNHILIQSCAVP